MINTTDTMLSTGMSPVWIAVGESATAATKSDQLRGDVADVREQPAGGDRRRHVDALELEEAHLRREPAHRRHRQVAGSLRDGLAFDRRGPAEWIGYLILGFGLADNGSSLALLQARASGFVGVLGIAPDPTAIATLGVLLLARGSFCQCCCQFPFSGAS